MITVVDAPCGQGKTSWALQYMNEHPEESFIFVTPTLDEVARVIESSKDSGENVFYEPQYVNRPFLFGGKKHTKTKSEDFYDLIVSRKNIATTHTTFQNISNETIQAIVEGDYHIILDEVVDVIRPFNDVAPSPEDMINDSDAKWFLDMNIITIDEKCRVSWNAKNFESVKGSHGKYHFFEKNIENGSVLMIDRKFFAWEFSPTIFKAAKDVTILTYLFDYSFVAPYFKGHNIEYQKASISGDRENGFKLVEYYPDTETRKKWKDLITIHKDNLFDNVKALSATWFSEKVCTTKSHDNEATKTIRNALRRVFESLDADASRVMWTCPKNNWVAVAPKGYVKTRKLTQEERDGKTKKQKDQYLEENGLLCWTPCVSRATNKYRDRDILAYMLDYHANPELIKYFDIIGVKFDRSNFSLSGLIQWICRSAIRDGKPITLYIPSARMKKILLEFLDGKR